MGVLGEIGRFVFEVLESSVQSASKKQYEYAKKQCRNSALSDEKRNRYSECADTARRNVEKFEKTQAKRDKLKNDLFGE